MLRYLEEEHSPNWTLRMPISNLCLMLIHKGLPLLILRKVSSVTLGYFFGISTAPAIFQRTIDTILQGLPQTVAYLDDILITGNDHEDHLRNLK